MIAKPQIFIRNLEEKDIANIVFAFAEIGWSKSAQLFQQYIKEEKEGSRFVWIAFLDSNFVGYVTLKLQSEYAFFNPNQIPEINDLNVLPFFQKKGIGGKLLEVAENKAKEYSSTVGIGVGLFSDYGAAQRLYVKKGYIPDGNGITYAGEAVLPGREYKVDDDLILWFTKTLK